MTLEQEKQEPVTAKKARLRGYVQKWFPQKEYGFIAVRGAKNPNTNEDKQWHFHVNSVRFSQRASLGMGVVVEFTPLPLPERAAAGKCDKATDVEVVG